MKRFFTCILIVFFVMGYLVADNSLPTNAKYTDLDDTFIVNTPQDVASVSVVLDLSEAGKEKNYLEVGFLSSKDNFSFNTTQESSISSVIELKIDADNATASTDNLYVYCKHRGNDEVSVNLTADQNMTSSSSANLPWKVEIEGEVNPIVDVTSQADGTASVYTSDGTWVQGTAVAKRVTITTDSFATKPAESYSGDLTISITALA